MRTVHVRVLLYSLCERTMQPPAQGHSHPAPHLRRLRLASDTTRAAKGGGSVSPSLRATADSVRAPLLGAFLGTYRKKDRTDGYRRVPHMPGRPLRFSPPPSHCQWQAGSSIPPLLLIPPSSAQQ